MTLVERLTALQEAFTGKSAEAEAKTLEATNLSAKVSELTEALAAKVAMVCDMQAKMDELTLKFSEAEDIRNKAVAKSNELTLAQVTAGQKGAEIAASVGVQPLEITPAIENAPEKTDEDIANEWAAMKQKDAKAASAFYTANRTAILRAAGLK